MNFLQKLYVRIWLAVVLAVAVLTLMVGWAWRMASEPPLRDVVVRNPMGEVIGNGTARFGHGEARHERHREILPSNVPEGSTAAGEPDEEHHGRFGAGPEFEVRMLDGKTMHLHLPRPPRSNWRAPFGFIWTLSLVAVAVALATYPIVRRLTRRLELLQGSVQRWGEGQLGERTGVSGDDEVGVLATGFNHAAQQIEALIRARDALLESQKSLLANASHELRSPLTRIRMGLELMGGVPDGTARDEITRNIAELDLLIDEILLASRLDAKAADMGTIEAIDLVGLAAEECAHTPAALDVQSDGAELLVPGVGKLLRRMVRNLLENAHRYADGAATLVLSQVGREAVIQVCDQGPGVPEALQDRIFEPFYRLPGASERDGGVGLGLALVKSIALRHCGTVRCFNRLQGGACFEVRLPMDRV